MIVVVAGVAGSGKTTVGRLLAGRLGWVFADADQFHPAANIARMRAQVPLTDADRWPWLEASAVVACSALKRSYRELLLSAPAARMVFLIIPPDADEARLSSRQGHFFPKQLLQSQFADLEPPGPPEAVLLVSTTGTAEQTADEVIRQLDLAAGPPAGTS
jgi:gluconokinase